MGNRGSTVLPPPRGPVHVGPAAPALPSATFPHSSLRATPAERHGATPDPAHATAAHATPGGATPGGATPVPAPAPDGSSGRWVEAAHAGEEGARVAPLGERAPTHGTRVFAVAAAREGGANATESLILRAPGGVAVASATGPEASDALSAAEGGFGSSPELAGSSGVLGLPANQTRLESMSVARPGSARSLNPFELERELFGSHFTCDHSHSGSAAEPSFAGNEFFGGVRRSRSRSLTLSRVEEEVERGAPGAGRASSPGPSLGSASYPKELELRDAHRTEGSLVLPGSDDDGRGAVDEDDDEAAQGRRNREDHDRGREPGKGVGRNGIFGPSEGLAGGGGGGIDSGVGAEGSRKGSLDLDLLLKEAEAELVAVQAGRGRRE